MYEANPKFTLQDRIIMKLREEGNELSFTELAVGLYLPCSSLDEALDSLKNHGVIEMYEENRIPMIKLIKKRR